MNSIFFAAMLMCAQNGCQAFIDSDFHKTLKECVAHNAVVKAEVQAARPEVILVPSCVEFKLPTLSKPTIKG